MKINEAPNKDRYTGRYHDWQISCYSLQHGSRNWTEDLTATAECVDLSARQSLSFGGICKDLHGAHPFFGTWYHYLSRERHMAPKFSSSEIGFCEQIYRHSSSSWHLTTNMNTYFSPSLLSWTSSSLDPHIGRASTAFYLLNVMTAIFQCWRRYPWDHPSERFRPSENHPTNIFFSFPLPSSLALICRVAINLP